MLQLQTAWLLVFFYQRCVLSLFGVFKSAWHLWSAAIMFIRDTFMYYSIQKFNFYSTGARLQTHHLRKITPVCLALIKLAPQPIQQNKCSRVSANHRHVVYVCVFMCIFFMSFDSLFQFVSQLQSDFVLLWTCRVYSQHDKKEKIQQVMGSLLKYFLRHLLIQVSVLYILCKYITFVNARFLGQRCLSSFCLSSSILTLLFMVFPAWMQG